MGRSTGRRFALSCTSHVLLTRLQPGLQEHRIASPYVLKKMRHTQQSVRTTFSNCMELEDDDAIRAAVTRLEGGESFAKVIVATLTCFAAVASFRPRMLSNILSNFNNI
eukprot:TRINITY_DN16933_c0_g2_i1.p1 TRINITY_DN16933_c0_g2~~TRINITY_DN16933_c0_g2_i1.p1  ORF type:complete len:109 (+),score=10.43 TRINITY_DN16933_c0_g2_i1:92-418(+)